MPLQQSIDEAFSQPARAYQFSVTVVGKDSGKKTRIILAFPVAPPLVIRMLTEIRHDGGPKLHQLSVLLGLSAVLFTDVMLEERAFVSLEKSQVSTLSCCRPVLVTVFEKYLLILSRPCRGASKMIKGSVHWRYLRAAGEVL